ncbi:Ig domain protein group 2 domain protein [Paludibacter propionicigenes WB4]|uniref:Ig domain protein group 2 domain protein n=1 Tax=Paludibacter propionicigenes (strain DSM 17365 / JCM 13257 / WB4) TaxID=694427 RepID=E4T0W3_PALPW|nr:Ig-like domain-containing protein [Paludibacter propionicigenes]ADQ78238.1 Ig domain protein group 2 domain protein [Paludibacter propionicigenes WB4]
MKKITFFCFFSLLLFSSCSKEDVIEITQITPSQTTALLPIGDSLTLTISCIPASATVPTCTWTSSNTSVATVDNKGKIKAIGRGTATIGIISNTNNVTTQCKVTVTYKGDGSASNPYLIYTVDDLKAIRDSINTKNDVYGNKAYKLMADLDFSKEKTSNWTPIGNTAAATFKGSFDGNGKAINNMHIGSIDEYYYYPDTLRYAGFFGTINGAEIKNISIAWNQIIDGKSSGNYYVGGIAAYGSGTITNCNSSGDMTGADSKYDGRCTVGGIIGYGTITTVITNCHYNSGSVSYIKKCGDPAGYAGGIAGYIIGTISNCYSKGETGYTIKYAGGIVGYSIGAIVNCYSTNAVLPWQPNTLSGGIAGYNVGSIVNCYSVGNISGIYSGGIAGEGSDITNCYASGVIYGFEGSSSSTPPISYTGYAGGIAATIFGNISNCIALNSKVSAVPESLDASAKGYAARICSMFSASASAKNNYAATSVVVKVNDRTNVTVTDFSDTKLHGFNLSAQPVDLLNAYVSANPTFNGISLKRWKVSADVNNGYPVFE